METSQTDVPVGREARLADVLRGARQAKGWELGEIAERTNVRKEYLAALEESRFNDLPEDIYAKNFVRLYAQTVGVPVASALELYSREQRCSGGAAVAPEVHSDRAEPPPRPAKPRRTRPALAIGAWLPTLLLIAAVVGLALWGFNNVLFQPTRRAAPVAATPEPDVRNAQPSPALAEEPSETEATALPDELLSLFTLTTDPPGAEVTLDGFPLPDTTPISELPLTPGAGRTLRVTLPGYEPYEAPIDVSTDLRLSVTLTPIGTAAAETAAGEEAAIGSGQVTVRIDDVAWLEAYGSTQRGVGERFVYTTAQPGETYTFDLPVYLHTGNAAGVIVTKDGQDLGPMGSSGEVVSRAYMP